MKPAPPQRAKRILVTGGAGYLGSILVAQLIARGSKVRVLDALLFGDKSLDAVKSNPNCELVRGDVRDAAAVAAAMKSCDAVVHLAAIVGDAACNENQQLAAEVNRAATRTLIEMAPGCGVRRFIFASSCSVYGASDSFLDETAALNPLSIYARTKIDSEKLLLAAGSHASAKDFSATVLRFGTLFGLSPRMRFDLVVNLFAARAASGGRITVFNAEQWRPFVHVQDAARAVLACLDAPSGAVSGQIFNAGSPALNLQIRDVGEAIQRMIPGTAIDRIENNSDQRNYRVSFEKIQRALGFQCHRTLESGIAEICDTIRSGQLAASAPRDFDNRTLARAAAPA
jgi:nucleoside-diphosphate-sugar epimerase